VRLPIFPIEDRCSICGRPLPHRLLRRCQQCGRWCCENCIEYMPDGRVLCLHCVRRRISPSKIGGKYTPLSLYLARRAPFTHRVTLTFRRVEEIIGDDLPQSAARYAHWWSNHPGHVQAQAWLNVGWRVVEVNLEERKVTFERVAVKGPEKPKRRGLEGRRPTGLPPLRPRRRRRGPSKTRVAKALARLMNIRRKALSPPKYRGKLKPRTAYEKRLYRPDARPG